MLNLCLDTTSEAVKHEDKNIAATFGALKHRSNGVAGQCGNEIWELLGLTLLNDPLRENVRQAIAAPQQLGISAETMTSIAAVITEQTAEDTRMEDRKVISSNPIHPEEDDGGYKSLVIKVYAECDRKRRAELFVALQKRSHRVAMTSDSFWEKASLELVNCGIAVKGATWMAQDMADVVMPKPGISPLVDAIRICR